MRETKEYVVADRIRIRPIRMEDTEYIVTWRNKDRVRHNFIYQETFTAEGHTKWMETKVATGEVEQFIIEELKTGRAIGSVYFRDVDYDEKQAEYGIFIGEDDAIGKGYGTLCAQWAVDYAGCIMGMKKLILRVFADNTSAVKSYQNAGFCQEQYLKDKIKQNGQSRPLVIMAVYYA